MCIPFNYLNEIWVVSIWVRSPFGFKYFFRWRLHLAGVVVARPFVAAMPRRRRGRRSDQPPYETEAGDTTWAATSFERPNRVFHDAPVDEHDFRVESQLPHSVGRHPRPIATTPAAGDLSSEGLRRHRQVTGSLLSGFEPQRHTMVVEGRPTQVLVLTHEGARAPEALPYLGAKWFPMPILNIFGRCARAEPAVHTHAAVWHGWRESFFYQRCRGL